MSDAAPQTKPPLGVMPCRIWLDRRIDEVLGAIIRYREADLPVPDEWFKELGLLAELRKVPATWASR